MNGGSFEWLFLVVEVIMYENRGFFELSTLGEKLSRWAVCRVELSVALSCLSR